MPYSSKPTLVAPLHSGLAGAIVLTLIHETARRTVDEAPRMDTLGRRSLARGLEAVGIEPPPHDRLQALAFAGDIVSNTIYYALVGMGSPERAPLRGAVLGGAAGIGAVVLPPYLGLGRRPRGVTPRTKAMTFAWYLAGGLAAGAAFRGLAGMRRQ